MDYLTPDERYWSCDIEADNLRNEATRIWCVCVENIQTGERESFFAPEQFKCWLEETDRVLVGHNFLSYDTPVLNRLWGTRIRVSQVIDTFLLSQMYQPGLSGGHSLEAWGERLNDSKGDFHDFSAFSQEMLEYCIQDVSLTAKVYRALSKRMKAEGFSETSCELEHRAWSLIQNGQKQAGFPFDLQKADLLYAELREREEELRQEIHNLWPPVLEHVRTFARGRKSDGERTANYLKHVGQYPVLEDQPDGSYHAYDYVSFDLGSPKQRIQKLLDLGWEPVNFTKKGSPKIDEDELLAFAESTGVKEAAALAKWVVVNARANMVRTWINAVNPKTGNIHGSLFLAGTGRYRHSSPNTANIPGVRHDKDDEILYGEAGTWAYECRSLWYEGEDPAWTLIGVDAKGIQLRLFAELLGNSEFTKNILSADPHQANADSWQVQRKLAKTLLYATLMSAGDKRIAITAKISVDEARTLRQKFFDSVPEFPRVLRNLQSQLEKTGRLSYKDSMPLSVSSPHMCVPYILQSLEALIMKQAMILIDRGLRKAGLSRDVKQVGFVHDEFIFSAKRSVIPEAEQIILAAFPVAGQLAGINIPIEGDLKVGSTWAQIH